MRCLSSKTSFFQREGDYSRVRDATKAPGFFVLRRASRLGNIAGKNRESTDFRDECDREIFRFVNGLAEAVRLIDINAVYVCERWVLSAYTINCLPPNESTERCSTLAVPKPNIAASLSRSLGSSFRRRRTTMLLQIYISK